MVDGWYAGQGTRGNNRDVRETLFPSQDRVVFRGDRHITSLRSLRYNAFSGRIQPSRLSWDDWTSLHGSQESDNNVQCVGGVVGIHL